MAAFDPKYFGVPPSQQIQTENRYPYTASASQAVFAATYTIGYVDVYLNGVHLEPTAFTAANGTTITLATPASAGDSVVIVARPQVPVNNIYTKQQVNNLVQNYYANTVGGTANAITATTIPSFSSWNDGMEVKVRMGTANTSTTPTISLNNLTALTIVRDGQQPLTGGDWGANDEVTLRYDITANNLTLMSGKLTVIAPPQFDNSARPVSSAFVQRALGNFQTSTPINAGTYTATNADLGKYFTFQDTSANLTFTMPLATSAVQVAGGTIAFQVTSSKTLTINRAGTDLFSSNGSTYTSWTLNAGDDATFVCAAPGLWFVTGSASISGSTAFKLSMGNQSPSSYSSVSTSQTWTASNAGALINVNTPGTTQTINVTNLPVGSRFIIIANYSVSGTTTITSSAGAGGSFNAPGVFTSPSFTINNGEAIKLVYTGSNGFVLDGGTAMMRQSVQMTASELANGYQKLPSGVIFQWGFVSTNGSGLATVVFPLAFPTACLQGLATGAANNSFTYVATTGNYSTTTMAVNAANGSNTGISVGVSWLAVGY